MIADSYNLAMPRVDFAYVHFGLAVALRRERAGLRQGELAGMVGVNQSVVSKWEQRANPIKDYFLLEGLAKALGCSPDDLVTGRIPAEWVGLRLEEEVREQEQESGDPRLDDIEVNLKAIRKLDEAALDDLARIIVAVKEKAEREAGE